MIERHIKVFYSVTAAGLTKAVEEWQAQNPSFTLLTQALVAAGLAGERGLFLSVLYDVGPDPLLQNRSGALNRPAVPTARAYMIDPANRQLIPVDAQVGVFGAIPGTKLSPEDEELPPPPLLPPDCDLSRWPGQFKEPE